MATDGIIRGEGNSRLIRSPNTIPTTFDAFRAQLIESGLPVDLLFNAGGWQVIGDFLNKLFFLTDPTETLIWGNAANRTVNEALAALAGMSLRVQAYLEPGTYTFTAPRDGYYQVEVVGAGGCYTGTGIAYGGGGAYAMDFILLARGQTVSCVIGAAGNATTPAGGASSFGSYLTASGGNNESGAAVPTKGLIRIPGGSGSGASSSRWVGDSFFGSGKSLPAQGIPNIGAGHDAKQVGTPGGVIIKYIA